MQVMTDFETIFGDLTASQQRANRHVADDLGVDTMASSHEFVKIWNFLKEREIRLIELNRELSALLEVLRTESRFFDSYRTTYEQLGQSNAFFQQGQTLRAIDEKLHELSVSE